MRGDVLVDDPRPLGAECLTNNAGELWALAEAFLWLRDKSGDDKSFPITNMYDSQVAKGLTTEPLSPSFTRHSLVFLRICLLKLRIPA